MGALGAVLLVGVPTVLMWRARDAKPDATGQASPPASTIAEAAPPDPAGIGLSRTRAFGAAGSCRHAVDGDRPSPARAPRCRRLWAARPGPSLPRPTGGTTPPTRETSVPGERSAAVAGGFATVSFAKMKLLVLDEGKSRDRDASLRLGPDALEVLDGERTIQSTLYGDVMVFFHSHSREPRWATPNGAPAPVLKVGGKFAFLKGTPDWITVRTKNVFIPLRVPDDDLERVIAELEARTGTKIVRVR